jgi:hypothetical protein
MIPVKIVGSGSPIQLFYFNMRRLGQGLKPDPDKSIPGMVLSVIIETVHSGLRITLQRIVETVGLAPKCRKSSDSSVSLFILVRLGLVHVPV